MKKKFILLFCIAFLISACVTTLSIAQTTNTAEERFLNDLTSYIYGNEIMYSDLQWVLDAFERFDQERSWESLQMARASLTLVRAHITSLELPEMEMTLEDQLALMEEGLDPSFMENADKVFAEDQISTNNICLNLHYKIMDSIFVDMDWQNTMRHVEVLQKINQVYIRYFANMVDWTLASLKDDKITEKMNGIFAEYCPHIHAYQAKTLDTPENIENDTNEILNELESLNMELSKIIGADTNSLSFWEDIMESGDLNKLTENLISISGLPPVLSYPEWYDDEDIFYYWKENGEVQPSPAPGSTLERIPDGCRIRIQNVSKDDYFAYLAELESDGLSAFELTEEDGEIIALYSFDESIFSISWNEDSVLILMTKNPIFFIPLWYFPAVMNNNI